MKSDYNCKVNADHVPTDEEYGSTFGKDRPGAYRLAILSQKNMKPIRFKPCGYVQNSNDKKYRLKWRTWPDPPIPTISRLLSRNCTEYLPACTWNNIWNRIRIRKTKYKPENTLTYTYFKNLPSVQSATITHYYTTHKADSSPFSPLSVLSADDKNPPSSFLIPKRARQEQTAPISTNRKLQAATSCTSILCQPDKYLPPARQTH